jgi:phytoene/squalene synthetase
VVNQYNLQTDLIDAFLRSMEMDLDKTSYNQESYNSYIFGSAEVIGLMCLQVFCEGDEQLYERLAPLARSLGAAFQKVNFLRDARSDLEDRGRTYFPGVDFANFTERDKQQIEASIQQDFDNGFEGIKLLPPGTKLGVYIAYKYFLQLFKKISNTPAQTILQQRIRVSDTRKLSLYCRAMVKQKLNLI